MITIRNAELRDLGKLTEIYNYYIENSNFTFDVKPHNPEDRLSWFQKFKNTGPYQLLVAEQDSAVVGYVSSNRYRDHFAFDQTIETSSYLRQDQQSRGIGSLLYENLFFRLKSEGLHKKFGFEEIGIFKEYAKKNGTFISSLWMQKRLGNEIN